jgi:hypothetical protein
MAGLVPATQELSCYTVIMARRHKAGDDGIVGGSAKADFP